MKLPPFLLDDQAKTDLSVLHHDVSLPEVLGIMAHGRRGPCCSLTFPFTAVIIVPPGEALLLSPTEMNIFKPKTPKLKQKKVWE